MTAMSETSRDVGVESAMRTITDIGTAEFVNRSARLAINRRDLLGTAVGIGAASFVLNVATLGQGRLVPILRV
jgi:hypothetical protein